MPTPNYIAVIFGGINDEQSGTLVAMLSDIGFEGFEEAENQLTAYISEAHFDATAVEELIKPQQLHYTISAIPRQNWNAVWEENFEPVVINNFAGIRAHFHSSLAGKVQHEIVITPKMSFGTGHHATTWMMIEQMQEIDFTNKTVMDFGTGTSILAILAEKLGAAQVLAIDIDEWSIANAKENIAQNDCHTICLQQADGVINNEQYDVILANNNKNIILQNLQQLQARLAANGCLLISGLLAEDEEDILAAASVLNLNYYYTTKRQQWIAMRLGG